MSGAGCRAALAGALLASAVCANSAAATLCGASLAGAQRVEGAQHVVAFAPSPAPWVVGRHLAVELHVCAKGAAALPRELRVDARMPEHGHGMNYRPSVMALAAGRWRAEGLLLHMAGRWELSIELQLGSQVERLVHALHLR